MEFDFNSNMLNWRRLSADITTSGQPSEEHLFQLKQVGTAHIINLGPHGNKGALANEPASVAALKMDYIYIPVNFSKPTDRDFTLFCDALSGLEKARTHVHCIYNARVTAFFYRYAKCGNGPISEAEAFEIMDTIWRPGHDWAHFIGNPAALNAPNLYAGQDY